MIRYDQEMEWLNEHILISVQVKNKRLNDAGEALLSSGDCQEDDSKENALDCEITKTTWQGFVHTVYCPWLDDSNILPQSSAALQDAGERRSFNIIG